MGSTVDSLRRIDHRRFVRVGGRCGDVLVSLPQEDRIRKVSLSL